MKSNRRRGNPAAKATRSGRSRRGFRFAFALTAALIALLALAVSAMAGPGVTGTNFQTVTDTAPDGYQSADGYTTSDDGLGVPAGAIKHVWVITMENHAYESNFTGLNDNNYLSQSLPKAGALLTNYYGTGHSSLDNYLSEMSGQAPITDDQDDCATNSGQISDGYTSMAGSVDTSGGSLAKNGNYGQFTSAAGPNAPAGDNGCVYPASVPTFFNQLDAAKTSWKVYAQDLDLTGVYGQNAGVSYCGAPDSTVGPTPSSSQTSGPDASSSPYYVQGGAAKAGAKIGGPSGDTSTIPVADQYVAKHNPLPWFESELNSGNCNSQHLAPLFGANDQLASDLQNTSSTPSFSFIVPNNCSNGHDAVCTGNNLSGGFTGQTPNSPINSVGGAYSADLFLEHIVPEIMNSPAYSDGGLIVINWDEAYPQFTYSTDSFADSATQSASAFNSLTNDSAGETLFGKSLNWEPSGPNVPNVVSQAGQQMSAGPGFNEYLDRPGSSAAAPLQACNNGTDSSSGNGYAVMASGQCYIGGGGSGAGYEAATSLSNVTISSSGLATQTANTGTNTPPTPPATTNTYGLAAPDDEGQQVTAINGVAPSTPTYIGQVTATPPAAITQTGTDTTSADDTATAQFQLVDASGNAVSPGAASGATLTLAPETNENDPFYDVVDATTGGGDSGAVLLSPYIKGGTVSNTYYNHYSLLRTLEDIFNVSGGSGSASGYTGSINVSTGVDGQGHLGYAAQAGLAPFGTDVFTNSPLDTATTTSTATVTSPSSTVTKTIPGSTVTKTTSRTSKLLETWVPRLSGFTEAKAKSVLGYAGLKLGKVTKPKAKKGYSFVVRSQSPGARKEVKRGSKVAVALKLTKNKVTKKK